MPCIAALATSSWLLQNGFVPSVLQRGVLSQHCIGMLHGAGPRKMVIYMVSSPDQGAGGSGCSGNVLHGAGQSADAAH